MEHSVNILNELEAISREVAQIGRGLPYTVPAGYFESLPGQLLEKVKAAEAAATSPQEELAGLSPLLAGLSRKLPFAAPAGYFSELTEQVVSGAQAIEFVNEELENLSPLMSGLKDKQVYSVPAGYFEGLPAQVLRRAQQAVPARVVSLGTSRRMMHYAVAAVVAGIIALATWWLVSPAGTGLPDALATNVDKIPEDELQDYLEEQTAAVLPADQLAVNSRPELDDSDMHDLLQHVSDEEIQKYLELNLLTKHTATN